MRCSNMAADSKTEKNLGHNLTVTRLVSLPKTRLRTTTGRYIVKYTPNEMQQHGGRFKNGKKPGT